MNHKHTCLFCGDEFTSQRPHSKFHANVCRVAYQRKRHKIKETQEKRFKESPTDELIKTKKGELTQEEQDLVDEGILNKRALLRANDKVRAKWVRDTYVYKPKYYENKRKVYRQQLL